MQLQIRFTTKLAEWRVDDTPVSDGWLLDCLNLLLPMRQVDVPSTINSEGLSTVLASLLEDAGATCTPYCSALQ